MEAITLASRSDEVGPGFRVKSAGRSSSANVRKMPQKISANDAAISKAAAQAWSIELQWI
jgi:hypothetical protein